MDPQLNPALLTPGKHEAALRGWFDIACFPAPDTLHLKKIPTHRQLNLGPLRVKRRAAPVVQDRSAVELAWFRRILHSLHA